MNIWKLSKTLWNTKTLKEPRQGQISRVFVKSGQLVGSLDIAIRLPMATSRRLSGSS
ncbi:unnamed protein product, partial [Ilex paraguariensis]